MEAIVTVVNVTIFCVHDLGEVQACSERRATFIGTKCLTFLRILKEFVF